MWRGKGSFQSYRPGFVGPLAVNLSEFQFLHLKGADNPYFAEFCKDYIMIAYTKPTCTVPAYSKCLINGSSYFKHVIASRLIKAG